MKYFNIQKKYVNYQIDNLKNKKIDPNNIVLNAAAFQDQLTQQFGIKKKPFFNNYHYKLRKKDSISSKPKTSSKKNENNNKKNMIDQIYKNHESEHEIINRNKKFLQKLTFAEKVGVQKIKNFPLSINQWKELEEKTVERGDHINECPICMEKLKDRESVILSCSHVFHKVCLRNFEKFTSVNKCPICRCEKYEKKIYTKDKEYFVKKSVILIQKYVKGYVLRYNLYKKIFKDNMPKNKHLRSIYSYWKIRDLTNKMVKAIEKQNKINKKIFEDVLESEKEIIRLENKNKLLTEKHKKEMEKYRPDWNEIENKVEKRDNNICAICLCEFGKKKCYILSCSHVFHKNCLDNFERFDSYYIKRCPLCRNNYTKKEIHNHNKS